MWDLYGRCLEMMRRRWPREERRGGNKNRQREKREPGKKSSERQEEHHSIAELIGGKEQGGSMASRGHHCPKGQIEDGCFGGGACTHQNIIGIWGQNPRNEQKNRL